MDTKRFVIGTAVGAGTVLAIGYSLFALPPLRDFYQYAMNVGPGTGVARDPHSMAAFTARKIQHPTGIFRIDTDANPPQHPDTACA